MLIKLHSQATTTPKIRAAIQASDEPAWIVAERHGTSEQTVWKWRKRDGVADRSHTPHRLQTTLTPAQEAVAVALRQTLLVSLDDLLSVVREFLNPNASRSGLDRCLRRHGVGNLRDMKAKAPKPKHGAFKAYEPGYIHIDVKYLPQMADESSRRYLFVAIDRATRWVFIRVFKAKTAANARRFLRDLERACPMRIQTILTDNGKEFTDRLFGLRKRAATGAHEFDTLCADLGIEHRLTPPKSPQTNGMVERFNGRIEDVLQSHHFQSGKELETTLHRYVWLYNQKLPQSALGSKTPLQAMKDWHKLKPELFKKQPYYLPGCDSYAISRYAKWESLPYSTALTATFPHGIRALIYQYFEAEPALQGLRGSSENLVIQDKLQEAFKADGLTAYEKTGIIQNVLHSNARLLNGPEGIFLLDKNRTRKILSLSRLHFLVRESKLESFEALQKLDSQYSDIRRLINDQELSGYQTTGRKIRNWKKRHLHSLIFLFPYSIRNAIARGCKQVCEGSTSLQRDLAANELALAHCGMKLMRQRSIDGRKSK